MSEIFTREQFEALERWGGKPKPANKNQDPVYKDLFLAHELTRQWAEAVQTKLFPTGQTAGRRSVYTQGQKYQAYTWWRIYPYPEAPRQLAYTVGIDASGQAIVKVDTVQANGALRARYEKLRGPTFVNAPCAAVLASKDVTQIGLDQLVEWSANAINSMTLDYDMMAAALGLVDPQFKPCGDSKTVRSAFNSWADALIADSTPAGNLNWLLENELVALTSNNGGQLATKLGVDPHGKEWVVEINQPKAPSRVDGLATAAVGADGKTYILRQGRLNRANVGPVNQTELARVAGLQAHLLELDGRWEDRLWYTVACVDDEPAKIRKDTAAFVSACVQAREGEPRLPKHESKNWFAGEESAEPYWLNAIHREEQLVHRVHGYVQSRLLARLQAAGISAGKERAENGYETDLIFKNSHDQMALVEIKTSASAANLQTGLGQLKIYRELIPQLQHARQYLLLPASPEPLVLGALKRFDVEVLQYDIVWEMDKFDVVFPEETIAKLASPDLVNWRPG